jgi:hypothetical protein
MNPSRCWKFASNDFKSIESNKRNERQWKRKPNKSHWFCCYLPIVMIKKCAWHIQAFYHVSRTIILIYSQLDIDDDKKKKRENHRCYGDEVDKHHRWIHTDCRRSITSDIIAIRDKVDTWEQMSIHHEIIDRLIRILNRFSLKCNSSN